MSKKAIITTLLVIQLILLVLLTFSILKYQKESYWDTITVRSVEASRIASSFDSINEDIGYLKCRNADSSTLNAYISFVTMTFNNYSGAQITLSSNYMAIRESGLEMQMSGNLTLVGSVLWQGICYPVHWVAGPHFLMP